MAPGKTNFPSVNIFALSAGSPSGGGVQCREVPLHLTVNLTSPDLVRRNVTVSVHTERGTASERERGNNIVCRVVVQHCIWYCMYIATLPSRSHLFVCTRMYVHVPT